MDERAVPDAIPLDAAVTAKIEELEATKQAAYAEGDAATHEQVARLETWFVAKGYGAFDPDEWELNEGVLHRKLKGVSMADLERAMAEHPEGGHLEARVPS